MMGRSISLMRRASFSPPRTGWPSASRSPARNEGRAITSVAKPSADSACSVSPFTRL
jgi:hypothetical protein